MRGESLRQQLLCGGEDLRVVDCGVGVAGEPSGVRVGAEGLRVAADELGPEEAVEDLLAQQRVGPLEDGVGREEAAEVEDDVGAVEPDVALQVAGRGDGGGAADGAVRLEVEEAARLVDLLGEEQVAVAERGAGVRGAVGEGAVADRQQADAHEAEAGEVHERHERVHEVDAVLRGDVDEVAQVAELGAGGLDGEAVQGAVLAAVHVARLAARAGEGEVEGELEEDVAEQVLLAASDAAHLGGLERLELVRQEVLGDDDAPVVQRGLLEVPEQLRHLLVPPARSPQVVRGQPLDPQHLRAPVAHVGEVVGGRGQGVGGGQGVDVGGVVVNNSSRG